jgi:ceramide glucosyltransferase
VLAEDYVLGLAIPRLLGKRVEIASRPIENVIRSRSLLQFVLRARRWSVLQRHLVGTLPYAAQVLRNPVFLAALGVVAAPSALAAGAFAGVVALRMALDAAAGRALRPPGFRTRDLWAVPVKDLVLAGGWVEGFFGKTVEWRGRRLRVLSGSRLAPPEPSG